MKLLFGSNVKCDALLIGGYKKSNRSVAIFFATCTLASTVALGMSEPKDTPASTPRCPVSFASPSQHTSPQVLRQELARLADLAEICDLRADFHAHMGALLLTAGSTQAALVSLEKALLLDPNLAGAQIDYAQALSRMGQRQTAQDLVNQVARRPDIEPKLKQWLLDNSLAKSSDQPNIEPKWIDRRTRNEPTIGVGEWSWAGRVQTVLGRETNPSAISHTTELPLYLDSGIVQVTLADSERPQASSALKLFAFVNAVRPVSDGYIRWTAAVQGRHAPSLATARSQGVESRISYGQATLGGLLSGTLGWAAFEQVEGNRFRDHSLRIEFQPEWRAFGCSGSAYVGRGIQRHTPTTSNNGHDDQAGFEIGCGGYRANPTIKVSETTINLSAGRYTPQNADRPGGIRNRNQIQVQQEIPLNWWGGQAPGILGLSGRWSSVRDQKIVSSLYGPDPTHTRRADIGVSYWHPIQDGWSIGIEVEHSIQRSSNLLLDIKNKSTYAGIRWTFQ